MTYIKKTVAAKLDEHIEKLADHVYQPDELAYAAARLAALYTTARGKSFTTVHAVRGALDQAADEYDENVVRPFVTRGGDMPNRVGPQEVFKS